MRVVFPLILCIGLFKSLWSQPDYAALRNQMVREQLRNRDIRDRGVLRAMHTVPRHLFVPGQIRSLAYEDRPLPIGEGQTISQPYMVAFMSQAAGIEPSDTVLEIGTGSGYQAAILSEIAGQVFTIEIIESLGRQADSLLRELGHANVAVRIGDGYDGWPEEAPFDAILVTAGAEELPQPLLDQLATGGRMVIPIGPHGGVRNLILIHRRKNGTLKQEVLMPVRFVPFTRSKKPH